MKNVLLVVISTLLATSAAGQFYGYKGKRFELGVFADPTANPALSNNIRYGINRDVPKGFALPVSSGGQLNMAISRRFGIGINIWSSRNFVGHRVPKVHGGLVTNTELPLGYHMESIPLGKEFRFNRNYYVKTNYAGIEARYYDKGYISPAGNFLRLGFGRLSVTPEPGDVYEYSGYSYYYGEDIKDHPVDTVTLILPSPEFRPYYLLSLGYTIRNKLPLGDSFFFDVGGLITFGIGRPGTVERVGRLDKGHNVAAFGQDALPEFIEGTTYVYLIKQNAVKLHAGLVFVF